MVFSFTLIRILPLISKRFQRNFLIFILFLTSFIWFSYIGRYKTIYGAGILAVPVVMIFALLPFFASAFVFMKSWFYAVRVYTVTCSILFTSLICTYYISEYKPSLYINIPQDYEGCVFIFRDESLPVQDVEISSEGIVYIPDGGDFLLKVRLGGKKLPEILQSMHYNQISYYNSDSTSMHWTDVNCFEVSTKIPDENEEYVYHGFYPCMEGLELRELLNSGIIDSSRLQWRFYSFANEDYYEP